jgi:hypothetical protein
VFVVGEELNAHHLDSGFVDEDVDVDWLGLLDLMG